MFDTCSLRHIESRLQVVGKIDHAVRSKIIRVIVPRTVSEQLGSGAKKNKGAGVPPFPVEYVGNTVGRVDVMACIDSIGEGEVFDKHRGSSVSDGRMADALIVDAASWHADILVSSDAVFLKRAKKVLPRQEVLHLSEFVKRLDTLLI